MNKYFFSTWGSFCFCSIYSFLFRISLFQVQILPAKFLYVIRDFICGFFFDLSFFAFVLYLFYFRKTKILGYFLGLLFIILNIVHLSISHHFKEGLVNFSYLVEYISNINVLLKTGTDLLPAWDIFTLAFLPLISWTILFYKFTQREKKDIKLKNIKNFNDGVLKFIKKYRMGILLSGTLFFANGCIMINSFYNNPLSDNSMNVHVNNIIYRMVVTEWNAWSQKIKYDLFKDTHKSKENKKETLPARSHFESQGYYFSSSEYILMKSKHRSVSNIPSSSKREYPNIVIIMLESIPAKETGFRKYDPSPGRNVTPFLNSLMDKSVIVPYFFANSDYTAGAETAAFCSTHDSLRYSIGSGSILRNYTYLNMLCLPEILVSFGYSTVFFHSYTSTFDNKHIFFPLNGIQEVIDQDHEAFKNSKKNYWGISDKEMLEYGIRSLSLKKEPFLSIFLMTNTHTPYILHDKSKKVNFTEKRVFNNYLNAIYQTDEALRIFFKKASAKKWFGNTIFLITSDNGALRSDMVFSSLKLHTYFKMLHLIPFLLYSPGKKFGLHPRVLDLSAASQIDITPTILDILNIEIANPFAGESLFKKRRRKYTFIYNWFNRYYRLSWPYIYHHKDNKLYHLKTGKLKIIPSETLFEYKNWVDSNKNIFNYLIYHNKIWPSELELKKMEVWP